jgi:ribose 5-phosphate isomerase B
MMTLAIGSDHAGYACKEAVRRYLTRKGHTLLDEGTHSPDSVDYPDFAHAVASRITSGEAELGIVICGSGNGVAMAANKHPGIRAALAWSEEIARLGRSHNDANVLAIPARFVSQRKAYAMVNAFLEASFEGGRHTRRRDKIPCG